MNVRLNNISIKCMLAILLAGLFASCKDEMEEWGYNGEVRPSRLDALAIGFTSEYDGFEKPKTRALIEEFNIGDQVGVLAMKSNDGNTWGGVFSHDTVLIKNVGDIKWSYANKQKWDKDYDYKFRGFYPINKKAASNGNESYPNGFSFTGGSTTLSLNNYQMSDDPRQNTDLLASPVVTRNYSVTKDGQIVPLEMKHLLACVDFKIKTKKGKKLHITSFTINGYAQKGDCTVNETPIWTPKWNVSNNINGGEKVNVSFNYNTQTKDVTEVNNIFIYKDKTSNLEILPKDLYNGGWDTGDSYLYNYGSKKGNYYVILKSEYNTASMSIGTADTDGSKDDGDSYEIDNYKGLLFIPQELEREGVTFNINYTVNRQTPRTDWRGNPYFETQKDGNVQSGTNVELRHSTFAKIEFYFDDKSSEVMTAYVDLTANNKVKSWDAGIRYVYTITMNEYQATANITIEDWQPHSYEEDLR